MGSPVRAAVRVDGGEEQVFHGVASDGADLSGSGASLECHGTEFEAVFLAHYARVVRILRRLVGNAGWAEELASEVFLRLCRSPKVDYGSAGHVTGWLYRTATNLGIDALRAGARRRRFEQDAARDGGARSAAAEDGYERTLRGERARRVREVLGEMKAAQAQLLFLRAEGLSYKELAVALGVEASSVGTLLVRAEAVFAGRYRERFGEEHL